MHWQLETIFYNFVDRFSEMCLWDVESPPRYRGRNGEYLLGRENVLQMPGGGELHAMILGCITGIGTERVIDSFVHYCIDNPHVSERSDKIIDMSKLNTTVDKISTEMQRTITLRTSINKSDFEDRWFERTKLMNEISELIRVEAAEETDDTKRLVIAGPAKGVDAKKGDIIAALVTARARMFKKHTSLQKNLIRDIRRDYAKKGISTQESRVELTKHTLFALSESVYNNTRYNTA